MATIWWGTGDPLTGSPRAGSKWQIPRKALEANLDTQIGRSTTADRHHDLGPDHAKYLKNCKKSSKNSRFLVLNIPFWVQNNRSKDFFKILFNLNGPFWGQEESFKTILGPVLGLFSCYYSWLTWSDPKRSATPSAVTMGCGGAG
jgi:hypothetical protein